MFWKFAQLSVLHHMFSRFGPKGFRGGGAGVNATTGIKDDAAKTSSGASGSTCSSCGESVSGKFCSGCGAPAGNGMASSAPIATSVSDAKKVFASKPAAEPAISTAPKSSVAKKFGGNNPKCGRCEKSVYANEKVAYNCSLF